MGTIQKIIGLCLFFLGCSTFAFAYQLSGRLMLNGLSTYEGSTVRVANQTELGTYYSATTSSQGFFTINDIPEGTYKVYAIRFGFQKLVLDSSLYVSESTVLGSFTMQSEKYRVLSSLNATLSADSVYYLTSSVSLLWGNQLTAEGGSKIKVAPNVNIEIWGAIEVSENEESLLTFTSYDEEPYIEPWNSITFYIYTSINRSFSHLNFCYGNSIQCDDETYPPIFVNCNFLRIEDIGLFGEGDKISISGSSFMYCGTIQVEAEANTIEFSQNYFGYNTGDSVLVLNSSSKTETLFDANKFEHNKIGLSIDESVDLTNIIFSNNLISDCSTGISYSGDGMNVINNVFVENIVSIYGIGQINIANNIFQNNSTCSLGFYIDDQNTKNKYKIQYNLFWDNKTDIMFYGNNTEEVDITNGPYLNRNNQPCDSLFNIAANPLFEDSTYTIANGSSPLFDAGIDVSSLISYDCEGKSRKLDGNADGVIYTDIGMYEFDSNNSEKTYSFNGTVYCGGATYSGASVLLFQISDDEVTAIGRTTSGATGEYSFSDIDTGAYLVYAMPDPSDSESYQPAYFLQALLWSDAQTISLEGKVLNADINLYPYILLDSGKNEISGTISLPKSIRNHDTYYSPSWFSDTDEGDGLNNVTVLLQLDGQTIQWELTDTNGAYLFENVTNGTYNVVVEYAGYTTQTEVTVPQSVKSEQMLPVQTIQTSAYPNPASHDITINVKENAASGECSLFNAQGSLVLKKDISEIPIINVSFLPNGMYFGIYHTASYIYQFKFEVDR